MKPYIILRKHGPAFVQEYEDPPPGYLELPSSVDYAELQRYRLTSLRIEDYYVDLYAPVGLTDDEIIRLYVSKIGT